MAYRLLENISLRSDFNEFSLRKRPAKVQLFQVGDNKLDETEEPSPYKRQSLGLTDHDRTEMMYRGEGNGGTQLIRQKIKSAKGGRCASPPQATTSKDHIHVDGQTDGLPCDAGDEQDDRRVEMSRRQIESQPTFDWSDILGHKPPASLFMDNDPKAAESQEIDSIVVDEPSSKPPKSSTRLVTCKPTTDSGGNRGRLSRRAKDVAKEKLHTTTGHREGRSVAARKLCDEVTTEWSSPSSTLHAWLDEKIASESEKQFKHNYGDPISTSTSLFMPSRSHPIRQSEFSLSDMDQSDSGIFDDSVNSLDSSDEILYLSCESEFPLPSDDNKWRPSFSSTPKMKANVPESSRKSDVQQDSSKPNTGDSLSTKSTQQTEICTKAQMYPFGSIVWGKFWKTHWFPAIVIDGSQAGRKPARMGFFWVMWFGDYKISELRLAMVEPFYRQFQEKCGSKLKPLTEKAVVEAIQACAERVDVEFPTYNSILRWRFSTTFQDYIDQGMNDGIDPFALPEGFSLPRLVIMHLRQIAAEKVNSHSEIDSDDEDGGILTDSYTKKPSDHGTKAGTDETGAGNQKVFCLPCGKYKESIVDHHPLFEGNICAKCKDSLRESLFALDEDGCCLFCNICGEGGALLLCDRLDCGRSFCMECVTKYISRDAIKQLKAQSPWLCFLCTPYSSATHGYILPRAQWRRDLLTFYNPVQRHMEPYLTSFRGEKRKLRVLSLFDGIGTVKLALEQLGLDIEVYYTCETSIEAEVVTSFNHGFSITQLGDAYKLDRKTLQDICPLDLVVGGPPAHDFDVTNREFEGFNDTGMLTLKFLMILREVELLSGADNPVFWLLETTACMKSEFYTTLTLLLEGEPCMWDAQNFAAHLRPRLYWGNLPGLYSAVDYCTKHDGSEFTLQSVLRQGLNRQAMVSKLRAPSLARKSDNQFTGEDSDSKTCMSHSLPIVMDDKPDRVWINEVERVIGFPEHYTDVSYLNVDQRQKLMATASSVPVLKHLLSPLTSMFAMKQ